MLYIRVRFFNLVEQDDAVRIAAHFFCQLAGFFKADIARRRTDQLRDRMFLHVFAHIEANHGVFCAKQLFSERFGELRFPDAGRADKQERTDRAVFRFQAGAAAADRLGDFFHRFRLADHFFRQVFFEMFHFFFFIGLQFADRDAGFLGNDLLDVRHIDCWAFLGDALLELFLKLQLFSAQFRRQFIVFLFRRLFFFFRDLDQSLLQLLFIGRAEAQVRFRAGLIQQVDRLVREEAVLNVAVRQFHARFDRLVRIADMMELFIFWLNAF